MKRLLLCVCLWLGVAGTVHGQSDGGGRSVFATGAGNRALSLGGAYAAIANDASAVLWNPAGLGLMRRGQLQTTTTNYYGLGINEHYASIALPNYRWGTPSLTVRYFGVSGIERRDDRNILLEEDLSDRQTEIILGYGRPVGRAWHVGAALKLRRHDVAGLSDSDPALDIGIMVRPLVAMGVNRHAADRLSLGLSLRNLIEPKLRLANDRVADPTGVRFGLGYWASVAGGKPLLFAIDIEKTADLNTKLHAGLELKVLPNLALRSGLSNGDFTAGTTVSWKNVGVEYSLQENNIERLHRFGISFGFGASVDQSRRRAELERDQELQAKLARAFESAQKNRIQTLLAAVQGHKANQNFDKALEQLAIVEALDPGNTEVAALQNECWHGRAVRLEQNGDFAEAAMSYSRALSLQPNDTKSKNGLARAHLASDREASRTEEIKSMFATGIDAFANNDLPVAASSFKGILDRDPNDADAARMYQRTQRAMDRQRHELTTRLRAAIDRDDRETGTSLLSELRRLGVGDADLKRFSAELDKQPKPRTRVAAPSQVTTEELNNAQRQEVQRLFRRGTDAMQSGRADEAVRYLELVWTIDARHQQTIEYLSREYLRKGFVAFADGDLASAITLWENVLRVDPDNQRARGYLKRARDQMNRTNEILGSR